MGRGLSSESKNLMRRIYAVFEEEHPNSPRRCAYALFGNRAGVMAAKVGNLCGRLLESGDLPLDWYDDSSRSETTPNVAEDMDDVARYNISVPSFDPWRSQPNRVKVWSEKSVAGTLAPVLESLCVPFLNTSGWNSRKMVMEEARLLRDDPRDLVIIYVGDHDASGLRMSAEDLPARFGSLCGPGGIFEGDEACYKLFKFEIRRVAVTEDDFTKLRKQGLSDPVKPGDPNARWYYEQTGQRLGVELEAIPAPVLRDTVEAAILECISDVPAWTRVMNASKVVRESWTAYATKWPRPTVSILGPDHG